jgi:hypothetical protein
LMAQQCFITWPESSSKAHMSVIHREQVLVAPSFVGSCDGSTLMQALEDLLWRWVCAL